MKYTELCNARVSAETYEKLMMYGRSKKWSKSKTIRYFLERVNDLMVISKPRKKAKA